MDVTPTNFLSNRMIIKIYCDLSFAIIETENTRESISVNDNGSILYSLNSPDLGLEKVYDNLEAFKMDNRRSVVAKWLAVGVCGMPMDTKKERQVLSPASVVLTN
jgi:hypothetical protein